MKENILNKLNELNKEDVEIKQYNDTIEAIILDLDNNDYDDVSINKVIDDCEETAKSTLYTITEDYYFYEDFKIIFKPQSMI